MYHIPHFKAHNENEVFEFMQNHPFIILNGVDENNKPVATHIPVLLEKRGETIFIKAHIMRNQIHTKAFEKNNNVLAIFSGAHAYVSAQHYTQQNTASTWNYSAVHASGKINFLGDDELMKILTELTEKFEQNKESPSLLQHMSEEYIQSMLKAIVAFEIEVEHIDHVFKFSQNKDEETRKKIIDSLENSNDFSQKQLALEMQKHFKD